MPADWKPSNQTARYDRERVARLRPIRTAAEKLQLPPLRWRKVGGILNALEMQIEDGGDSPEVNRLLLEAVRAAVRHQVDERQARDVWRAIEVFEQAEAERWEQVRAGTLTLIQLSPEEQLDELMQKGYDLLEARKHGAACDRWLEAWELVKRLTRPEFRKTRAFDAAYPGRSQFVFNWCQDLESELRSAGASNPIYHQHRARYARELLELFPDEDTELYTSFMRAQGEVLWSLGQRAEAEAVFSALVKRLPDEVWVYIGWADQHWIWQDSPKNYEAAEAILKRAMARPNLKDRSRVLERLAELYGEWGKTEEQATIAAQLGLPSRQPSVTPAIPPASTKAPPPMKKLSRNAPCWCGSGKKYKRCHLQADEEARR